MIQCIYHEKQYGSLCGIHALNNLLQLGPVFSPDDLADIAQELDNTERELMLSQGLDTDDAIKFLAEDSGNVDDSGNFSFDVMNAALERRFDITLSRDSRTLEVALNDISMTDTRHRKFDKVAFICNHESHWYTIRELGDGEMYDLNSLNKSPKKISKFYLNAYLAQLKAENWSIFVVIGNLPEPETDVTIGRIENWYIVPQQSGLPEKDDKFKAFSGQGYSMTSSSTSHGVQSASKQPKLDEDYAKEISASEGFSDDYDEDLKKAIELSMMNTSVPKITSLVIPSNNKAVQDSDLEPDDNYPGVVRIQFVLPDGSRKKGNFEEKI